MKFKHMPIVQFKHLDYRKQLAVMYAVSGFLLSSFGLVTNMLIGIPFLYNIPSIVVIVLCLLMLLFVPKQVEFHALVILTFIAVVFMPVNYFVNFGYRGAMPIYFVLIVVYFALLLQSMKTSIIVTFFITMYYVGVMIVSYYYPELVYLTTNEQSIFIDQIIGVIIVSFNLVFIAWLTVRRYKIATEYSDRLVIELEQKNETLRQLSVIDHLTGVYQRQVFLDLLKQQLCVSSTSNEKTAVMMIDIDNFKDINDTWGHLYGDEVLVNVVQAIKSMLRDRDVIARYGGEEFVVMLQYKNTDVIYRIAERIREAVEQLNHRENHRVTISIGITYGTSQDEIDDIIRKADKNMYKAKHNGRNRTFYE